MLLTESKNSTNLRVELDSTSQSQENETNSLGKGPLEMSTTPTQIDELFKQGLSNFSRGDYRTAIDYFSQALRINPDFADAYHYRGLSRYHKGDRLGAIKDYSQVIRINPENAEAYCNRGLMQAELNERWGAMQDYNQALQIDPKHIKTFLNRSAMRLELEDYQGGIADCNDVLNINPNLPKAYLNRGMARFELEDYQGSLSDFNQVLQINPNIAEAYFNRGLSQVGLENYQEALSDFNHSIQLNPNYTQAYLNRGYTRLQLGDNDGSIEDFDQALRLDRPAAQAFFSQITPTLTDDLNTGDAENQQLAKGLVIQGYRRYELGEYQAALNAYTQALELDPNNIEAYNRRSTVRSALGDYQGALEDIEKAKSLSVVPEQSPQPNSGITLKDYCQRGVDKLQNGDFAAAISDFNQVLQMYGNDATVLTCRGLAYRRSGDNERAIEDLQAAAQLFYEQGDEKSAQEILETIKKFQ
jgi:tetratricopeptide (TPR) repeat protein